MPGQVIPPEKTLTEIIKPGYLNVLAYNLEYKDLSKIKQAYMKIPELNDKIYRLTFEGISAKIEENKGQAILFSLQEHPCPELIVGMKVEVKVTLGEK